MNRGFGICAFVLGACLVPATAMAETQKHAIEQVLQDCSAFSAERAEGSQIPDGWTLLNEASSENLLSEHLAAELILTSIRDVNESGPFRPMDVILDTFKQSFESSERDDYNAWNRREQNARYLFHESGWSLIAFFDDHYKSSYCRAWHNTPDAETVSFLSQPVFGIRPRKAPFGDMISVSITDDGTYRGDSLRIEILLNNPDRPWKDLVGEDHPTRFIPRVYVRVF